MPIATLRDAPEPVLAAGADERKRRTRVAEALALKGMDTSPIQSWTQGAARLAQALVGGHMSGELAREEAQERKAGMEIYDKMVREAQGDGASAAPSGMASPVMASPTMGGSSLPPQTDRWAGNSGKDDSLDTLAVNRSIPASIRTNNPGAQYPGPSALAYGSTGHDVIGGGHKIARFNTPEEGAAAQFDLLARNYSGMPLSAAIHKWSGGNSAPQYVQMVSRATGLSPDTVITPELLRSPKGVQLVQAMAQHEAGRPFPMAPEQWQTAQARAFGGGDGAALPPGATPTQGQYPRPQPGLQRSTLAQALANRYTAPFAQQYLAKTLAPKTPKWEKLDEATLYEQSSGRTMPVAGQGFRPLVDPADRARFGIPAEDRRPYQVGPGGKLINPPPESRVNIDQRGESKFAERAGGVMAERFGKLVEAGDQARGMVADFNTLREIGSRIGPTGKTTQITESLGPYAEALGVKIEGLSDLQAYRSIVSKMAPRMRPAGSGATSDYEMRQYLEALPGLGKTEGGNQIIISTQQSWLEHQQAVSDIASRALAGEMTPREAEKMIRELPDPLAMWKKSRGTSPAASSGKTSSGVGWTVEP